MTEDDVQLWGMMMVIGMGTFMLRFSFIWLFGRGKVRPEIEQMLKFVPPSVLAALALPAFIFSSSAPFSFTNPRLLAGLVAAMVAWRSRNVLLTIVIGMAALWLITNLYS